MGHCTKHQMRYGQGETCLSCTADLRERWDRAFYAALTGLSSINGVSNDGIVHHAVEIAALAIRRHTDMMAARDVVIAEGE